MASVSVQKLHLEDSLDDTPQTRAMIDLFEKDALMLKKFSKAFSSSCQKVLNSQAMMISATQEMSYYLRLYGKQNFPLDPSFQMNSPNTASKEDSEVKSDDDDHSLASTLNQFANYIDEISTCFQVLVTQLNDAMIYPLNKLIDNEFDELNTLNQMYHISSEEEEQARQKLLRISNRKEYDAQRKQANEEVYAFRKKFHQTSMSYFSFLNTLQFKRKYMFIEPMLSFVHSLRLFFKMGSETFSAESSSKIDSFLNDTSSQVCEIKANLSEEINKTNQLIDLMQQDDSIYYAELPEGIENQNPISENVLQKSGYLNLRSKFPFISKWDRAFYFIQNGYLMHQQKSDVAGSPFMELKSDLTVSVCEIDDRSFTFQINSQFPKKTSYFQANSKRDRDEWIKILENAIKDDNKSKILNHMNTIKLNNPEMTSTTNSTSQKLNKERVVKFELSEDLAKSVNKIQNIEKKISKPEQGDSFKVRFLGSMNVNSDKGNEYINETIRQVMASRAEHNVFKLSEFNLVINSESISLFKPIEQKIENNDTVSSKISYDDLLKAQFDLSDIGFWSSHRENERLFGFIVKEKNQSFKFTCHVFESDVNSNLICESITKATQLAFKLLVDNNKSEHLKKIKEREKEILLQNIQNLPDKAEKENVSNNDTDQDLDDDRSELLNAAKLAMSSPNPNFIVLDREMLENFNSDQESPNKSEHDNKETDDLKNTESDA